MNLHEAHRDYLSYLALGGERFPLPYIPPALRKDDLRIRASQLGRCPIATARKKLGIAPTHPLVEDDYGRMILMQEGVRVADIWQEALKWAYPDTQVEVELELPDSVGRADAILKNTVIEIKRTDSYQPTEERILQLWWYMIAAEAERGILVYQRRDKPADLYEWHIDSVDRSEVQAEIDRHKNFLERVKRGESFVQPALDGLLPYQCCKESLLKLSGSEAKRPRRNGQQPGEIGTLTVNCPFFGHCYPGYDKYNYVVTGYKEDGSLDVRS